MFFMPNHKGIAPLGLENLENPGKARTCKDDVLPHDVCNIVIPKLQHLEMTNIERVQ